MQNLDIIATRNRMGNVTDTECGLPDGTLDRVAELMTLEGDDGSPERDDDGHLMPDDTNWLNRVMDRCSALVREWPTVNERHRQNVPEDWYKVVGAIN